MMEQTLLIEGNNEYVTAQGYATLDAAKAAIYTLADFTFFWLKPIENESDPENYTFKFKIINSFTEYVEVYLELKNLSVRKFAQLVEVEYTQLSKWLNGKASLSTEKVIKVIIYINDNIKK